MDSTLWRVALRADGGGFGEVIVSARSADQAAAAACHVEKAPLRSVVSVMHYREGE